MVNAGCCLVGSVRVTTAQGATSVSWHSIVARRSASLVLRGVWREREVAVKLCMDPEEISTEALVLRYLQPLPAGIMPPLFTGELEAWPSVSVLVRDFIDGDTLHGAVDVGQLHRIVSSLKSTLNFVHEQGIVHRDLKPSNIILDRAGQPWIIDFGCAAFAGLDDSFAGTRLFAASGALKHQLPVPAHDFESLAYTVAWWQFGQRWENSSRPPLAELFARLPLLESLLSNPRRRRKRVQSTSPACRSSKRVK